MVKHGMQIGTNPEHRGGRGGGGTDWVKWSNIMECRLVPTQNTGGGLEGEGGLTGSNGQTWNADRYQPRLEITVPVGWALNTNN